MKNNKIDKLAKECWSHKINGTLIDGHLHFDYHKFAEMIIRQCIVICEEGASTQMTSPGAGERIRTTFGVE